MKHPLLYLGLLLSVIPACSSHRGKPQTSDKAQRIPLQSFARQWSADLKMSRDPATRLYLTENNVFVYSRNGDVTVIKRPTGELVTSYTVRRGGGVRPPVVMKDSIVYPTQIALEVFDFYGRRQRSLPLRFSLRTNGVGKDDIVYLGGDYAGSSRVAAMNIKGGPPAWELLINGGVISATPAIYKDAIYFGAHDHKVYALALKDREPIWSLPEGVFITAGPIVADVIADETGVYVASTDSKLYAINRNSGKLIWQYFAGTPLKDAPVVTKNYVYQLVRGAGLAAINNLEGKHNRDPVWIVPSARRFLSDDDKYAYLLDKDNRIIAVEKTSGQIRFTSTRRDFTIFDANTKGDGMIYGATPGGEVMAIRPVLKPGMVGEIVLAPPSSTNVAMAMR